MTTEEISAAFPFESHYVEVRGSQMHYVDEGEGDPIVFLHGNPTSCYLWRNIIPYLVPQGRCIAPDLIGMGKSDKPDIEYRFYDHLEYIEGFIDALGLESITLVIHDWGGALGFQYAMDHESNVKAIAFMEPVLPSQWQVTSPEARQIFDAFRTPDVGWGLLVDRNIFIENILPGGILRPLSETEKNHYREPFTEPASRKPIWRWPNELPIDGEPADIVKTMQDLNAWLEQSDLPKLLFYAEPGAIFPAEVVDTYRENLKNLKTINIGPGNHYIQEDNPHLIGSELADWYRSL
jgi:haloalkane dehalogenase